MLTAFGVKASPTTALKRKPILRTLKKFAQCEMHFACLCLLAVHVFFQADCEPRDLIWLVRVVRA